MELYRFIPIMAVCGLLLAACGIAIAPTQSPTDKEKSTPLPGGTSISQEDTQTGVTTELTLAREADSTQNPSPTGVSEQPVNPPTPDEADDEGQEYEIVTLLPRDAIEAIFSPQFLTAEEADAEYLPDEPVMGVVFDGEARAYSISFLANHEIVNDTVAGRKIAVTW